MCAYLVTFGVGAVLDFSKSPFFQRADVDEIIRPLVASEQPS